jgi:hypothetical protein
VHEHDRRAGASKVGVMDGAVQIHGALLHRRSFARLPDGAEGSDSLRTHWWVPRALEQ